jgi:hypothetical protein
LFSRFWGSSSFLALSSVLPHVLPLSSRVVQVAPTGSQPVGATPPVP